MGCHILSHERHVSHHNSIFFIIFLKPLDTKRLWTKIFLCLCLPLPQRLTRGRYTLYSWDNSERYKIRSSKLWWSEHKFIKNELKLNNVSYLGESGWESWCVSSGITLSWSALYGIASNLRQGRGSIIVEVIGRWVWRKRFGVQSQRKATASELHQTRLNTSRPPEN